MQALNQAPSISAQYVDEVITESTKHCSEAQLTCLGSTTSKGPNFATLWSFAYDRNFKNWLLRDLFGIF